MYSRIKIQYIVLTSRPVVAGPSDVVLAQSHVGEPAVGAAREAVGGGEDVPPGDEGAAAHHGEAGGGAARAQDGRPGPSANVSLLAVHDAGAGGGDAATPDKA